MANAVEEVVYDKILVIGNVYYMLPTPSIPILDVGGDEISKINHDIDGFHDNIDEILYTHRIPPCSSLTTSTGTAARERGSDKIINNLP